MADIDGKAAYVRDVTERTRVYLRELQQENERLRNALAVSETERRAASSENAELRRKLETVATKRLGLDDEELARVESENKAAAERYLVLEQKNNHLANLYVASYRLHQTLSRDEVLAIVQEIVINLIGCEQHSLYEVTPDRKELVLLAGMGIDLGKSSTVSLRDGPVAHAVRTGEIFVAAGPAVASEGHPYPVTACVPLRLANETTGAIVLYQLLPQKPGIEDIDRELFDLLATHAAMALYATKLHQAAVTSG